MLVLVVVRRPLVIQGPLVDVDVVVVAVVVVVVVVVVGGGGGWVVVEKRDLHEQPLLDHEVSPTMGSQVSSIGVGELPGVHLDDPVLETCQHGLDSL